MACVLVLLTIIASAASAQTVGVITGTLTKSDGIRQQA
jgi:hypothetical protein